MKIRILFLILLLLTASLAKAEGARQKYRDQQRQIISSFNFPRDSCGQAPPLPSMGASYSQAQRLNDKL